MGRNGMEWTAIGCNWLEWAGLDLNELEWVRIKCDGLTTVLTLSCSTGRCIYKENLSFLKTDEKRDIISIIVGI